ncbi:threonine/serine exporter family protein [Clostridium sp. D2Q-14]|nr:threonine/serine exporter family protein [Anaeromonas gelatinilytica]MBS4534224.1 threonine/serine exporter family protein [Anaeromonas gelatinilytica]
MFYIKQFIYGFLSTMGFSIIFNTSRESISKSSLNGAIGWIIYIVLTDTLDSSVIAAFFGALSVGILGELFARFFKKPATIFIIPGIVPLVPGSGMYYTMLAITEKRFIEAADLGSETLFIAASIASALIVSISIGKLLRTSNFKKLNKKKKNF